MAVTTAERDELILTLLNALAEESRRKNEALAGLMRAFEKRLARLEQKVRKRK